jgi:hypothetical protein
MLKQKRSVLSICQYLGMSQADFAEVMQEGVRRNLFEQGGNLSQYGELCYREIAKKVMDHRIRNARPLVSAPALYVPDTFRGTT